MISVGTVLLSATALRVGVNESHRPRPCFAAPGGRDIVSSSCGAVWCIAEFRGQQDLRQKWKSIEEVEEIKREKGEKGGEIRPESPAPPTIKLKMPRSFQAA